jgi:hypothetical protein
LFSDPLPPAPLSAAADDGAGGPQLQGDHACTTAPFALICSWCLHVVTSETDINLPLLLQQDMMNEEALAAAAEREENMQRNGPCEFVIGFVLVRVVLASSSSSSSYRRSHLLLHNHHHLKHHLFSSPFIVSGNVFRRYLLDFFYGFKSVVQAGDV